MAAKKPTVEEVDKLNKKLPELADNFNKLDSASKKAFDDMTKGLTKTNDISEDLKETIKELSGDTATVFQLGTKEAEDLQKAFKRVETRIKKLNKQRKEGNVSEKKVNEELKKAEKRYKDLQNILKKSSKEQTSTMDGLKMYKAVWQSMGKGPSAFRKQGIEAGILGGHLKETGERLSHMKGKLKVVGQAAGIMAKTVGGGLIKLAAFATSPVGWVAAAVAVAGAAYMAADKFVKDANKRFLDIRGPDIMTKDTKKQFEDFNNQIYDIGANLKIGLNAEQIVSFMGALVQTGAHLDRVKFGLNDYRKSVSIAAQASRNLGVDLVTVGSMMGTLITEYNMDLTTMKKTFTEVAFNAQRAGMSTGAFWDMVTGATTGLAFYGVGLEKTGKLISKIAESGLSQTQVKGITAGLTGGMASMSAQQRIEASAALTSRDMGGSTREAVKRMMAEAKAKKEKGGLSSPEAAKLDLLIKDMEGYFKAGTTKDQTIALSKFVSSMPDQFSFMIADLYSESLKRNEDFAAMYTEKIAKIFNRPEADVQDFIRVIRIGNVEYENLIKGLTAFTDTSEDAETKMKNLADKTSALMGATTTIGKEDAYSDLVKYIAKASGRREEDPWIRKLVKALQLVNKNTRAAMIKKVSGVALLPAEQAYINKAIESGQLAMAEYQHPGDLTPEKGKDKAAEESAFQIASQTTSIEDMAKIVGEGSKWYAASFFQLKSLDTTVWSIFRMMAKEKGGEAGGTPLQLQASGELERRSEQLKGVGVKIGKGSFEDSGILKQNVAEEIASKTSLAFMEAANKLSLGLMTEDMKEEDLKDLRSKRDALYELAKYGLEAAGQDTGKLMKIMAMDGTTAAPTDQTKKQGITTTAAPTDQIKKQGITDAIHFNKETPVIAHSGETLFPRSYQSMWENSKRRYIMPENSPGGIGTGKGRPPKAVVYLNITVTDRDLEGRMKNTVNGILRETGLN